MNKPLSLLKPISLGPSAAILLASSTDLTSRGQPKGSGLWERDCCTHPLDFLLSMREPRHDISRLLHVLFRCNSVSRPENGQRFQSYLSCVRFITSKNFKKDVKFICHERGTKKKKSEDSNPSQFRFAGRTLYQLSNRELVGDLGRVLLGLFRNRNTRNRRYLCSFGSYSVFGMNGISFRYSE